MGVYRTRWSTKELLCLWLLCWIPGGVLACFGLGGTDWHDPLNWIMYVLMAWMLAVVLLLPVASFHPQRFGWFDGPGDPIDDDLDGPL